MELCWLTCVSSALNGEELTRCGGTATLGQLLTRTVSVLPDDVLPTQVPGALKLHEGQAASDMLSQDVLQCYAWSLDVQALSHCSGSLCRDTRFVIAAWRRDCDALPAVVCWHGGVCLCTRGPGRAVRRCMTSSAPDAAAVHSSRPLCMTQTRLACSSSQNLNKDNCHHQAPSHVSSFKS